MPANSLKTRFKAWWDGYDPPEDRAQSKPTRSRNASQGTRRCNFSPEVETLHMIFGAGRTLPLPLNPIIDLPEPLKCPTGMAALLTGAETCGPAIELATRHEIQITALEPDRRLVVVGEELAREQDFGGTFRIGPVDLANVEISQNRYHLVISRLMLHQTAHRDVLYRKFERALRRSGHLILTQFVLAEDADADAIAASLTSSVEPEPGCLATAEDESQTLVESGLRPQVIEDLTDQVVADLAERFGDWQDLVEQIASYQQQPRMLQTLLAQVEHWQPRMDLMKSGDLRVMRFQSEKRRNELL